MDATVAKHLSKAVPRYTSYPTAPHFSDAVDSKVYAGWLAALDRDEPISLYLHVPFCRKVCWYCGCNMKLASRYEPIADYVETLLQELALVRSFVGAPLKIRHLHWGGGTPTTLTPDDLSRVMAAVGAAFDILPDAEIAIECDPRTMTAAMAKRIGELGFTRASFGVQEFDPKVQAAINRIQPPEMVAKCVGRLRGAGVSAINFDLIYGLPHQTADMLEQTVADCVAMQPDRLALFGYAHVPWMAKKQRKIDEADLPDSDARFDQASRAAQALVDAGYDAIGLDHFALPDDDLATAQKAGRLRRNFQGYTVDEADTMIGLGSTSIGRTPSGYLQNHSETGAWARAVQAGVLPVSKGIAVTADDRLRSDVIERLMCDFAADVGALSKANGFDASALDAEISGLAGLADDGLVEIDGRRIRIAPHGRVLVRVVCAAFDAYLPGGKARHSVAV
jgi:oxygen-independent coproporphyrinogen-3 oxidase